MRSREWGYRQQLEVEGVSETSIFFLFEKLDGANSAEMTWKW